MLNIERTLKYAPHLFSWLALMNIIDATTTAMLIHWGGLEVEVNPFMRMIIGHHGTFGMFVYKGLAIVGYFLAYEVVRKYYEHSLRLTVMKTIIACCVVYTLLAIHNLVLVAYVWYNLV